MIKTVPSFPQFKVSDTGEVFGVRGKRRPSINKKGYRNIIIYCGGGRKNTKRKSMSIHRMVWEAFNGPIPKGMVVRHLDNNPVNNHLSNLAIGTHQDNNDDRMRAGHYYNGEQHHSSKLSNAEAEEIRNLRRNGVKVKSLADTFKVSISTIESIIYNKSYTTEILSTTGRPKGLAVSKTETKN